jgi:coenzyme F420-0:L-glutamate ligase/coenzyme F420-1:gamma-L-glutamate ligase
VPGIPEVKPGDDLGDLIDKALDASRIALRDGDVVAVASKVISKAEGRIAPATSGDSETARELAGVTGFSAADVDIILSESVEVLRASKGVLVTETKAGYVCANAGVDRSNSLSADDALLLPADCDAAAAALRAALEDRFQVKLAVVVTDTFGRPFREGQVNVALGVSGMRSIRDYRGQADRNGYLLKGTEIAVADELASAAELVMNKLDQVPVAVIRGYAYEAAEGSGRELLRPRREDIFR